LEQPVLVLVLLLASQGLQQVLEPRRVALALTRTLE
jgi:hypothetical protein